MVTRQRRVPAILAINPYASGSLKQRPAFSGLLWCHRRGYADSVCGSAEIGYRGSEAVQTTLAGHQALERDALRFAASFE